MRGAVPIVALMLLTVACGGGSGSNNDTDPPPTPPRNPCSAASIETDDAPASAPTPPAGKNVIDGDPRWRALDSLWTHREGQMRRALRAPQAALETGEPLAPAAPPAADVGDIAVVQDTGDLVLPPNAIDLSGLGLRFTRNGSGGYDVARIDGAFRSELGTRVTLTDDDSASMEVPFGFPFYGKSHTTAFVNSDGNVTFEEEDKASTERNVARLLTGPPRVAPFLSDLDPSTGAGRVFVHAAASGFTVTWCNVRAFESQRVTSVQATLLPDGLIEFKFGEVIVVPDAVVGISPGRTGAFQPVDLSAAGPTPGGQGAVGERFAERGQLDVIALTKAFYATHPDNYDQLVIWTDQIYVRDAFAYENTVANEVRGIGVPIFDLARDFGSPGRLRSIAMMDFVGKYPDNPTTKFLGENNTLSVLGQEVGHRWLAYVEFRDHLRNRSDLLLGRGRSHWSFFFDSDASVMEGNDIEDLGGGSFRTVAAVNRYSLLDQYLMGIVPDSFVPPFFYVENPSNQNPIRDRDDGPLVGVTFNGTRRTVLIDDIIAIHGPRNPTAAQSSKVLRQAFILLVTGGRSPDAAHIDKVNRIRMAWEGFFLNATDRRMTAETRLN